MSKYRYWIWSNGDNNINKTKLDNKFKFKIIEQNKKEKCIEDMSKRELVIKNGSNPFMTNNNYIDDLNTQSKFLMPKNSNYKDNNTVENLYNNGN
tara:strand:- start:808 stop:1092 length:285 start_codon:yes stop_codon:yes gene_type:complete